MHDALRQSNSAISVQLLYPQPHGKSRQNVSWIITESGIPNARNLTSTSILTCKQRKASQHAHFYTHKCMHNVAEDPSPGSTWLLCHVSCTSGSHGWTASSFHLFRIFAISLLHFQHHFYCTMAIQTITTHTHAYDGVCVFDQSWQSGWNLVYNHETAWIFQFRWHTSNVTFVIVCHLWLR